MNDSIPSLRDSINAAIARKVGATISTVSDNTSPLAPPPSVIKRRVQEEDAGIEITYEGIAEPVRDALNIAFERGHHPIFLHGLQGRGKTMAAYFYARLVRNGRHYPRVLWYTNLRDLQSEMIEARSACCSKFAEATIVVIDNFGAASTEINSFIDDELIGLMDRRMGKPVIVCSNHSPNTLKETLSAPLISRLLSGTIIEYTGPDRRIQQAKSRRGLS